MTHQPPGCAATKSNELQHRRGTALTSAYPIHGDDCALPVLVLQCLWVQLENMEIIHELGKVSRRIS